jgi:hypothetical protein
MMEAVYFEIQDGRQQHFKNGVHVVYCWSCITDHFQQSVGYGQNYI